MSYAARRRRQRRTKGGVGRVLLVFLALIVVAAGGAAAAGAGWVMSVADGANLDDLDQVDPGTTSVVYAADGTRLGFLRGSTLREVIATKAMSPLVREATVAVEDRRFYQHKGVDVEGVFRAATRNITSGGNVEGASTLEMQLIRNLWTQDTSGSIERKIREAKLAQQLEDMHPGRKGKEWVLTKYLNSVPYGNAKNGLEIKGVEAASRIYFEKPASKLTLAQAAMIAGLPQAPSQYNPYLHPTSTLKRRNEVIDRMADQGMVTQRSAARAKASGLGVKDGRYYVSGREQAFVDYVRTELVKRYGRKVVNEGGLKVYTTIDLKKQQQARASLAKNVTPLGGPSGAVVSLEPDTGDIETMATTAQYGQNKYNLITQGERQPGSTFKIMVLMAALREGIDPDKTTYVSRSGETLLTSAETGGEPWAPKTYGGDSGGSMTIRKATLKSDNSVYAKLGLDVGPENVVKAAKDMGVTSPLKPYPSISLGSQTVTPLEMARAYATIANGGKKIVPRAITKVVFPDGKVERPQRVRAKRTFEPGVASEATSIMADNVKGGTGTKAQLPDCPAAGKTGTTDKEVDAWFNGFTRGMVTTVWVGHATGNVSMPGMQGGGVPAQTWHDYMAVAKGGSCGPFRTAPFSGTAGHGKWARGGSSDKDAASTADDDSTGSTEGGSTAAGDDAAAGTRASDDDGSQDPYPADSYESAPQDPPN
ncbi:transglycosylase domain-containing protein [Patulibacter sp. SYSU D01012]|uniref:transglycosylase domain-containing protein n=1 Tax=Patulibacter sp. SYSU D01012 TaxID=2817381 RepID=UPI001B30548D|nr:transglycosylase domain-containing protein [Patulibacter sp. SYSU D01012]